MVLVSKFKTCGRVRLDFVFELRLRTVIEFSITSGVLIAAEFK